MSNENQPTLTMEFEVHFSRDGHGLRAKPGPKPKPSVEEASAPKKLPRVVRMLALAHHLDNLLQKGIVKDYADIARLAGLSRARITQIMNLLLLAPEIQEQMLGTPEVVRGVNERNVRLVVKKVEWENQRILWRVTRTPNQV